MRAATPLLMAALLSACGPPSALDETFFIRSRGADMPVWVRGDLSGSNVMLVYLAGGPGGPGLYSADQPAFVRLSKQYGLALWDQRLSGSSMGSAGVETLTLEQYVTDLDAVVQVLRRRYHQPQLVLMGHSWGGLVGAAYLSSSPVRQQGIAGWVDVDGVHSFASALALSREWAMAKAQERVAQGEATDAWSGELAWYDAHPTLGLDALEHHGQNVAALGGHARHPENDPGLGTAWMNCCGPFDGMLTLSNATMVKGSALREGSALSAALYTDLTGALPSLTLPSLVLWGEHDGQVPLGHGEEAFRALGTPADAKALVVLHQAAHNSFTDEPEGFAAAIERFADRLR